MNAVPRLVQEVLLMSKHSSHTLQIMQQAAAFRLRQLLDELGMLMGSLPDLRDAFDPDELPLEFILKRFDIVQGRVATDGAHVEPAVARKH